MPSPKSGTAGSAVTPADPDQAVEADDAKPGTIDQAITGGSGSGSGSASNATPHKSDPKKTSWIEIVLVDEDKNPVPGQGYQITLPDGTVASGTLDDKGFARVEGFDSGNCQVTFPDLDKDAWDKA